MDEDDGGRLAGDSPMTKWISECGPTHLYPTISVERRDSKSSNGRASGPAYCGGGGGESVFAPRTSKMLDRFLDDTEIGCWSKPCPDCARIIRRKLFADKAWQQEFREEHFL